MKNVSIKKSIAISMSVVLALAIVIGLSGLIGTITTSSHYESLLDTAINRRIITEKFASEVMSIRKDTDELQLGNSKDALEKDLDILGQLLDAYEENYTSDNLLTTEAQNRLGDNYKIIREDADEYLQLVTKDKLTDKDFDEMTELADAIEEHTNTLIDLAEKRHLVLLDEVQKSVTQVIVITSIIMIGLIGVGIWVSIMSVKVITKPINQLVEHAKEIANGNFDIELDTNTGTEIGNLAVNFELLINSFKNLINDVQGKLEELNQGNLNTSMDESVYMGEYRNIAHSINLIIENTADDYNKIINSIRTYSNGDFQFDCPTFDGDKVIITKSLQELKANLSKISQTITCLIGSVRDGNLQINIPEEGYQGDWLSIIGDLNMLVQDIRLPINETQEVLKKMSKGDFQTHINEGKYKGAFADIAKSANIASSNLRDYIQEISNTLSKMANKDLDIILTNEYKGDFRVIQDALNLIITNFNNLINDMLMSSEQVAIGSQSIADTATNLAQGATEQASSVQELTALVQTVASSNIDNVELIEESNSLIVATKESADIVDTEMKNLLSAMEEISNASARIGEVMDVIDDIAFQTNILALNASIEAARAGQYGSGFAVVANEVRLLASKSAESAQQITETIETSMEKTNTGSLIAKKTSEVVNEMNKQIGKVGRLSEQVEKASKEQNTMVKEITTGINQISQVVTDNSMTSEESAAASQQLASQSAVFQETVQQFKLRQN
jgi:methyl-accepting chemotaxis protein